MTPDRFNRLIAVADLPPGGGMPIDIAGKTIAVFNVDGSFYAIDNECPHRGAPLADGALLEKRVVCLMHRWQFDLRTGRNPMNPELRVRSYPLAVRGDELWIDLTDPN